MFLLFSLPAAQYAPTRQFDEAKNEQEATKESDESVSSNGLQHHHEECGDYWTCLVECGRSRLRGTLKLIFVVVTLKKCMGIHARKNVMTIAEAVSGITA